MSETTYTNGASDTGYRAETAYRSDTAPRRGITDILASITQNAADLASAEVRLARDEAIDTGKESITGGILTLFAGVIGIPVLIFLGLALSAGLIGPLGPVAANLITAAVFTVVALVLYFVGKSKIGGTGEPLHRTRENLRQDRETVRENLH
ncbi:phage holin family protein [Parvularcula maris]|uniref:Phage holin family protein n=1 Tax=Parvularcula maris TaxID=2965077 RepID=A0A9X2L8I9_9PROT|nr:phage holin family protein [Parvularcula maris]MCQ8184147.1 phage holin family protein [Parvularcula maris]